MLSTDYQQHTQKAIRNCNFTLSIIQEQFFGHIGSWMNTVDSDISHAVCTAVVQSDNTPYNESSVRTSARQVNNDVQTFFRPLLTKLHEER